MRRIKKAAALLIVMITALSLVSCGKEKSPLEKLAGYYEADIRELLEEEYPDLESKELDMYEASLASQGYVIRLNVDKEGNGSISEERGGDELSSRSVSFDPDSGTAVLDGQKIAYTYASRTIELDGVSYVRTSKRSEAVWPFGASVSVGGCDEVGYFWVPDDWYDTTDWLDEDLVVSYESPDEDYSIMVFTYTKEERETMDQEVFESPASLLEALTSNARSKRASSITTDDTFSTEVNGNEGARNDMFYNDDTGETIIVSIDENETFIVMVLNTETKEATSHMDEFAEYVAGHYSAEF